MSDQDDICGLFKGILNYANARIELHGLEQSSFSYNLPEDGLTRISEYLHTNNRFLLTDAAVRGWILDRRIIGEIVWTPIHPDKNGDWKQEQLIKSILAVCNGGTRRLEDWVGNSSDKIDRGGRQFLILTWSFWFVVVHTVTVKEVQPVLQVIRPQNIPLKLI